MPAKQKVDQPSINQLRRILGQLRGAERQLYERVPLPKVLQQLEAARCSLASLECKLIQSQLSALDRQQIGHCLRYLTK